MAHLGEVAHPVDPHEGHHLPECNPDHCEPGPVGVHQVQHIPLQMREMSSLNKEEEKRGQKKRKKEEEKLIRGKTKRKIEEKEDILAVEGDAGESEEEAGKAAGKGQFHLQIKIKDGQASKSKSESRMDKFQNGWSLNKVKIVES